MLLSIKNNLLVWKSIDLKWVVQFIYIGTNISLTESNIYICKGKAWTAIDRLLTTRKFALSNEIKWEFFQVVAMSIFMYDCITWTLIKYLEKKLDGTTQGCYVLFWTNTGRSNLQNSSCLATYLASHKLK